MSQASYITLDLDIVSSEDLSPLEKHLEEDTFILGLREADGLFYLSLEPGYLSAEENTPENSANLIIDVLQDLPNELKALLARASSRVFNFGFDSGVSPPPHISSLSTDTLRKIVELGASIEITIYQCDASPAEPEERAADN